MAKERPTFSVMLSLYTACKNRNLKTWHEVKAYAEQYKKYDCLSLRDIDKTVENLAKN
jgi:hypothetical protein